MRTRTRQPGMALLLVLMVLSTAVVVGLAYLSSAALGRTGTSNFAAMARARHLAESGVAHAVYLLREHGDDVRNSLDSRYGPFTADAWGGQYEFTLSSGAGAGEYWIVAEGRHGPSRQLCRVLVRSGDGERKDIKHAALLGGGEQYNLPSALTVNGPLHVNGSCVSSATLAGAATATGLFLYAGQPSPPPQSFAPAVEIPPLESGDYYSYVYKGQPGQAQFLQTSAIDRNTVPGIAPGNPAGVAVVRPPPGQQVSLGQNVQITGTLIVEGDLYIGGNNIYLTAGAEGFPALVVTGRVYVRRNAHFTVNGLLWAAQAIGSDGDSNGSKMTVNGALVCPAQKPGCESDLFQGQHQLNYDPQQAFLVSPDGAGGRLETLRWLEQ